MNNLKSTVVKSVKSLQNTATVSLTSLTKKPINLVILLGALVVAYMLYTRYEGFEDEQNSDKKVLVLFYAPWCGHCKALKPEWDKVEQKYQGNNKVEVKKVNCDENPDQAAKNGVESYPTIILFKGKEKKVYDDERNAKAIESFLISS